MCLILGLFNEAFSTTGVIYKALIWVMYSRDYRSINQGEDGPFRSLGLRMPER
jgi:hypothetical protein